VRVAFLTGEFPVLWETPFLNQITGLVERGHDVDIYADRPQLGVPAHPDVARLGLLDRARYPLQLPPAGRQRWAEVVRLIMARRGEERAVLLRTLNPLIYRQRALSLEQFRRTSAFLPRRTYDICYCAFAQDARRSLRIRRLGVLGGKLVVALRGSDITRYLTHRGEGVYAKLFRKGDLFLPVCEAFARQLVRLGCPPSRIVVHHTGINLKRFPFRPPQRDGSGPLRLLTVARLVEKKGIEYALRAVRQLDQEGMDLSYEVVGDGPLKQKLELQVEKLGLAERVRLVGAQSHAQVQQALDRANILLAPCVTARDGDQEGIPNVLREAMAVGLPVIATHHSGIPELVEDGVSGYLVPERDPAAIVRAVRHLADHPEQWLPLARAARARVEEDDIEKLNDRLVGLLEGVLATTVLPARAARSSSSPSEASQNDRPAVP
jgi:colanic acid/amylovoran/stewartan biosynthesis glycosyltransferase WcaL/AmsK/CpsK